MLISFSTPHQVPAHSITTPPVYVTCPYVHIYVAFLAKYIIHLGVDRGRESSDVVKSLSAGFRKSYTPRENYIWFSYYSSSSWRSSLIWQNLFA